MALPKKTPAAKAVVKKPILPAYDGDGLPEEATDQTVSLTSLKWLFVAPPGFGKTELFTMFPESLLLACEEGHKFVTCFKMIIDEWDSGRETTTDGDGNMHIGFLEACKRITKSVRFKFIVIDTLDALIKKCIDHHLGEVNAKSLKDMGDYGVGHDLGQNNPIRSMLSMIMTSGRGMGLITHQFLETKTFAKGRQQTKKETTLPPGIFKLIFPQMDLIIHGEFGGIRAGNEHRDRIIKSQGSEEILAKNRGGVLPHAWISPLDPAERTAQIQGFFDLDEETRIANIAAAYAEYREHYED